MVKKKGKKQNTKAEALKKKNNVKKKIESYHLNAMEDSLKHPNFIKTRDHNRS